MRIALLTLPALLGLLAPLPVLCVTPFEAMVEEWEAWKLQYGKNYTREEEADGTGYGKGREESFRMKIWIENKAAIEKHNRHFYKVFLSWSKYSQLSVEGVYTYKLAMNEFGDLLHNEFVSSLNGYRWVGLLVTILDIGTVINYR